MDIGKTIKNIRIEEGLTQQKFANKVGISRTYLSDVENNRYNPSVEMLQKIAKAFNKELKIEFT